ncbi:MAG TPA: hypothetical protein HPP83_04340 [Candidatus Hydrogenedentes bacterium]|nr:hypothetical protein [Candidatus Hydrogenedentota bacterium]
MGKWVAVIVCAVALVMVGLYFRSRQRPEPAVPAPGERIGFPAAEPQAEARDTASPQEPPASSSVVPQEALKPPAETGPVVDPARENATIETEPSTAVKLAEAVRKLQEIEDEHSELLAEKRQVQYGTVLSLDDALKDAVLRAFRHAPNFDRARRSLQDVIQWHEMPQAFAIGAGSFVTSIDAGFREAGWDSMTSGDGDPFPGLEALPYWEWSEELALPPVVLYREVRARSGIRLYVLQNAMTVCDRHSFGRVRGEPYALIIYTNGDIRFGNASRFYGPWPDGTERIAPSRESGPGIAVLDIFETGDDVPWVAIANGPRGRGRYVDLSCYAYDSATDDWKASSGGGVLRRSVVYVRFGHVRV